MTLNKTLIPFLNPSTILMVILLLQINSYQSNVDYQIPELAEQVQIDKTSISMNGIVVEKVLQNDFYIGQIASYRIDLWHKDNMTHFLSIKYNDGSATYLNDEITDADLIKENSELIYILVDVDLYEVNLTTNSMVRSTVVATDNIFLGTPKGLMIQVSESNTYAFVEFFLFFTTKLLYKFKMTDWTIKSNYVSTFAASDTISTSNFLLCEETYPTTSQNSYTNTTAPANDSINEYLAIWRSDSLGFDIYGCIKDDFNWNSCIRIKNARSTTAFTITTEFDLRFNHDCTKYIYDLDSDNTYTIESVYGTFSQTYDLQLGNINSSITRTMMFMDYEEEIVLAKEDINSLAFYNTNLSVNSTYVDSVTAERNFRWLTYDIERQKMYFLNKNYVAMYTFECPANTSFSSIGKCSEPNTTVVVIPEVDNVTNSTNITEPQSTENNTNITSETTNQQVTETNIYEEYSETEAQSIETASQVLDSTTTTAAFTVITLTFLPFSAVFIKLISFWTVCSFYALVQIDMPQYLQEILIKIFKTINISLLNEYDLMQIPQLFVDADQSNDKIQDSLQEDYELTSDFAALNFENLCMVMFSLIVLKILYLLSKIQVTVKNDQSKQKQKKKKHKHKIKQKGKSKQKQKQKQTKDLFQLDFANLTAGQILSVAPMFMVGIYLFQGKSDFSNLLQKANLVLFSAFIGFTIAVPFLYIAYTARTKPPSKKQSIEQSENEQTSPPIVALTVVYFYSCNILVPLLSVLGNVELFLSANFLVFGLGTYCAWKSKYQSLFRQINSIIVSLWLVLVNICMTAMHYFPKRECLELNKYLSMMCLVFILLGALHELLNFLFILFEFLYNGVFAVLSSNLCKSAKVGQYPNNMDVEDPNELANQNCKVTFAVSQKPSSKSQSKPQNSKFKKKKKFATKQPAHESSIDEREPRIQQRTQTSQWLKNITEKRKMKNEALGFSITKKAQEPFEEQEDNEPVERRIEKKKSTNVIRQNRANKLARIKSNFRSDVPQTKTFLPKNKIKSSGRKADALELKIVESHSSISYSRQQRVHYKQLRNRVFN